MPKRYELIDHTADIGLRAYGRDLKELFINAACGMFAIAADLTDVQTKETMPLKLTAPDAEELFLSWLSELLYLCNSREIIFKEFLIDKISEKMLAARAKGERLNLGRHRLKSEIKAVTYHRLKVERAGNRWQAEVIFDV